MKSRAKLNEHLEVERKLPTKISIKLVPSRFIAALYIKDPSVFSQDIHGYSRSKDYHVEDDGDRNKIWSQECR